MEQTLSIYNKPCTHQRYFIRECYILSKLHHENIVSVYNISKKSISMESLNYGLNGQEPIDTEKLYKLIDVLCYLEDINLVHGDVSIDNIMFRKNGDPVLIDFDLAFRGSTAERTHKYTFASPEEISTDPSPLSDKYSDVYALGISVIASKNMNILSPALSRGARIHANDLKYLISIDKDKEILNDMISHRSERLSAKELAKKYNIPLTYTVPGELFDDANLVLLDRNYEAKSMDCISEIFSSRST